MSLRPLISCFSSKFFIAGKLKTNTAEKKKHTKKQSIVANRPGFCRILFYPVSCYLANFSDLSRVGPLYKGGSLSLKKQELVWTLLENEGNVQTVT